VKEMEDVIQMETGGEAVIRKPFAWEYLQNMKRWSYLSDYIFLYPSIITKYILSPEAESISR
jgi:hypothetical protein